MALFSTIRKTRIAKRIIPLVLFCSSFSYQSHVLAQSTQTNTSGTNSNKFGFVVTNSYGVSVTSTQTPGYEMEGEASMGILPGSYVKNRATPSGVSLTRNGIQVTGVQSGMELNLDPDKTKFYVRLRSPNSTDATGSMGSSSTNASSGTASISATGNATTTFTVESAESINNSSFVKTF